jgi:hypothetical protein
MGEQGKDRPLALARRQKTGGSVPYGYSLAADGRTVVVIEGEQSTIARVRPLAAEGRSLRAVATSLRRKATVSRTGRPFFAAQVGRMLEQGERSAA